MREINKLFDDALAKKYGNEVSKVSVWIEPYIGLGLEGSRGRVHCTIAEMDGMHEVMFPLRVTGLKNDDESVTSRINDAIGDMIVGIDESLSLAGKG